MKLIPFRTMLHREINRFMAVWGQAVLAPILSVTLYLVVFGVSLGGRIDVGTDFSYLEFIAPGLMMIGIITNSSLNANFSIFISKLHGSIFDVLVAPIGYIEMTAAYILSSVFRGLLIGGVIYGVGYFFSGLVPVYPVLTFVIAFLTAWCFSALGAIIGIWAKDFDQLGIFNNFIITPLIFLGGVFYSIEMLPVFWQKISVFNPLLYMVDSLRYGFLGVSDINPLYSIVFLLVMTVILTLMLLRILKTGWRLRT